MLIPSIDLMGGKIVQLVQGKKKALEFENFDEWIGRFSKYPMVQLIDLDAAIGSGSNRDLVQQITQHLPCQVGGGIRSVGDAEAVLAAGAKRVIVGSALFAEGKLDAKFAHQLAIAIGSEHLMIALDAIGGLVAIHGWRTITEVTPLLMMRELEPWCAAFLYTNVDTEGLLQGFPIELIRPLRQATSRQLIAAGGIRSHSEIDDLDQIGVDAVVGMAIYQGLISTE